MKVIINECIHYQPAMCICKNGRTVALDGYFELPPPNLSNSFKELRCNYCSVAVEVPIKLRGLYDGSYQLFKQKQFSRKTILN